MLIDQYTEASEPLVTSRVIASSLLADLRSSNGTHLEPLGVENVLRLLEMYRSDDFYADEPRGILEQDDFADLNALREFDGFNRLKEALRSTHATFLPGSDVADFTQQVTEIFKVLRASNEPENLAKAQRFLSDLTNALSNA